jgi:hypothetical protein
MKNCNMSYNKLISQWLACASTFLSLPRNLERAIYEQWQLRPPDSVATWYKRFTSDVFGHPLAYQQTPTLEPYTEIHIEQVLEEHGWLAECPPKKSCASVILSHDIDHLYPSTRLSLKRLIAERKYTNYSANAFLDSLQRLLEYERQYYPAGVVSTLFIAAPHASSNLLHRAYQKVIDPSYQIDDAVFFRLADLINTHQCQVGLHGSYYSLSDKLIGIEKRALSERLNRKITAVRQHWLRLPHPQALLQLQQEGFTLDSTLGWNNAVGFRGGMARQFPIMLSEKLSIIEQPLNIMDCAATSFADVKTIIEQVHQRNGELCLNWHERSATKGQVWFDDYNKIHEILRKLNFKYASLSVT